MADCRFQAHEELTICSFTVFPSSSIVRIFCHGKARMNIGTLVQKRSKESIA